VLLPSSRYREILNPDPPVAILLPGALDYLQQTTLRNHTMILPEFLLNILIHVCNSISDIPGVLFSCPDGIIHVVMTVEDIAILKSRVIDYYVSCYFLCGDREQRDNILTKFLSIPRILDLSVVPTLRLPYLRGFVILRRSC